MRLMSPEWVRGMVAVRRGDPDAAAADFEGGLTFHGGPAGPRPIANSAFGLACVDVARGRSKAGISGHASALRRRHSMGDRLGVAESLMALAAALAPVEPADAARLLGAAVGLLSAVGAVPTPRQEADLELAARAAGTVPSGDAALDEIRAVELALALAERLGAGRRVSAGTT
jgi:hypothetical protein